MEPYENIAAADRDEAHKDKPVLISGLMSLPRLMTGSRARFEADAVMDDGRKWVVKYDASTRLAMVYDAQNTAVAWTERSEKKIRQIVLADSIRPPVCMEDGFVSRSVWIGDRKYKAVMMLEGRKRVFGSELLKVEHRDFQSEARFLCEPGMELTAVIVAFEVYCVSSCRQAR